MVLASGLLRGRMFDFVFAEAEAEKFASSGLGRSLPLPAAGRTGIFTRLASLQWCASIACRGTDLVDLSLSSARPIPLGFT